MRKNRQNSINVSSRDVIPLKPPDTATTPEIKTTHPAKNQIFGQALYNWDFPFKHLTNIIFSIEHQ